MALTVETAPIVVKEEYIREPFLVTFSTPQTELQFFVPWNCQLIHCPHTRKECCCQGNVLFFDTSAETDSFDVRIVVRLQNPIVETCCREERCRHGNILF